MRHDYALKDGSHYSADLPRDIFQQERVVIPIREKMSGEDVLNRTITLYDGDVDRPAKTDVAIKHDGSYSTIAIRMDKELKQKVLDEGSCTINGPGVTIDILLR